MIFHLGKGKSADDETVREETFRRWREASEKAQGQVSETPSSPPAAPLRTSPEVEEIRMDSMRAVEWPDPRSTISLTKEVSAEEPLEAHVPSAPPKTNVEPNLKSPTSRLAQFVSSGLSALGNAANAPKPATPIRSNVEVLRTVDNNPLELERRPNVNPPTVNPLTVKTNAPQTPVSPSSSSMATGTRIPENGVHLDEDIRRRFGTNIRSALGPGTIIEGTFSFDTPVCIEGTLIGEVRSNSALIVGPQATVSAKVRVGTLIVFGAVQGDVEAEELVEIKSGGSLEGDVESQRFAMEDGCWFRGRSTPKSAAKKFGHNAEQTELYESEELLSPEVPAEKWTIGN